ncbi:uncharacterized protein EAF01_009735 [Botrytis porri]|uniref:uncharacterized protein n=1 Tax=Botrytis porri TaxID=87229 RepID=UPI0018FF8A07|nr:uncharacterized protein EAF01_009735 [Botrytis porri]KAF7895773.1 hypothetical protein EAF01_009735 [Botrytis porri]
MVCMLWRVLRLNGMPIVDGPHSRSSNVRAPYRFTDSHDYAESIEMLYTQNLFRVEQNDLMDVSFVLKQTFTGITALRVKWLCQSFRTPLAVSANNKYGHYYYMQWVDAWNIIPAMGNIKHLYVELRLLLATEWLNEANEAILLEPIAKITSLKGFVIHFILFSERRSSVTWQKLPCELLYGNLQETS